MKPVVVGAVATWGLRLQASLAAGKNQRTQSGAGGGGHQWRDGIMPAVGRYKKREAPLEMPPVSVGNSPFTQPMRRANP